VSNPPSGFWLEKEPPHRNEPLMRGTPKVPVALKPSNPPGGMASPPGVPLSPSGSGFYHAQNSRTILGIIRIRSPLEKQQTTIPCSRSLSGGAACPEAPRPPPMPALIPIRTPIPLGIWIRSRSELEDQPALSRSGLPWRSSKRQSRALDPSAVERLALRLPAHLPRRLSSR